MRISDEVKGGWSRAVVAKQLAEKVQRGRDVTKAVLETLEELKAAPGAIVPIADVPDIPVGEVTVEGEIIELWSPSSSAIQQVGLIEDESGRTKFTVWEKSRKTVVREGQTVRFRAERSRKTGTKAGAVSPLRAGPGSSSARSVVGRVGERVAFLFLLCAGPTQTPPPHPPLRARFAARAATTFLTCLTFTR